MSSTDDTWREAESQLIEKMLQKMAVLSLISYIRIKGEDVRGYVKFTGDRLGRLEKAKEGTLWDWIKSKTNRHILLLCLWVQDS